MSIERALILSGGGARGAFQVGVCQYLQEAGWVPEMVCGTSIGAINAVAIGSGMKLDQMAHFWKIYDRRKMFRITMQKFMLSLFKLRKFSPLMDPAPLRDLLSKLVDLDTLRKSSKEIIITAVNLKTSQLRYFNNNTINIDHVMASAAVPIIFPWQFIDGEPHWDGGVMDNTPIIPALEHGAKKIIVVLLSPVGAGNLSLPQSHMQVMELMFEHSLIGAYNTSLEYRAGRNTPQSVGRGDLPPDTSPFNHCRQDQNIAVVAPTRMLGFRSFFNFSKPQVTQLIREGYNNARKQLKDFIQ
jgi:NTE family protein